MTQGTPNNRSPDWVEDSVNRVTECVARRWIATVSFLWLIVVAGAVAAPLLASQGYDWVAQLLYWVYRPMCPQRPSHSFFIAGYKMAFEQRETAMFLAASATGPLFILLRRLRVKFPGWLMIAALIPMGIDVGTQMVGMRHSDGFWRSLTGTLAVVPFILWLYAGLDVGTGMAARAGRTDPPGVKCDSFRAGDLER